jgi:hypothetical protein
LLSTCLLYRLYCIYNFRQVKTKEENFDGLLVFGDTRKQVVKKLGPSSWESDDPGVKSESWQHKDRQLNVDYSGDKGTIGTVYYGIREFFDKDCEHEL